MNLYDRCPEINSKNLELFSLFEVERYFLTYHLTRKIYRKNELHAIKSLADYLKIIIPNKFHQKCLYVDEDLKPKYYIAQVNSYFKKNDELEVKRIFPEPNYFVIPGYGYTFPLPSKCSLEILPTDFETHHKMNKELYALFFAFKIRNISILNIRDFLSHQDSCFKKSTLDFSNFLEYILTVNGFLLNSDKINLITKINVDYDKKIGKPWSNTKDLKFEEMFNDHENILKFFQLLKSNFVLDQDNIWIYEGSANSVRACFEALVENKITIRVKSKKQLYRIIKQEIKMKSSQRSFERTPNIEELNFFKQITKSLK